LAHVKLLLTALMRIFQFARKRQDERLRQDIDRLVAEREARDERERERQHQLEMVKAVAQTLLEFAKTNQEGILKLAEAQTAQAEILATWMKGFQATSVDPIESISPKDDDWENPYGLVENEAAITGLPAEFQLAYSLKNDPNPNFDREGRDEF
jgi:hypothetical protein